MEDDTLKFIIYHVVSPPKLPQKEEENKVRLERELLEVVQQVLKTFVERSPPETRDNWSYILNMIDLWFSIGAGDRIDKTPLAQAIANLKDYGAIALHIRSQNCGWIAYYDEERAQVIIDAFEVSASGAAVLAAKGPLLRCFPGQSVSIPVEMLSDPHFCDYLADSLCRLNAEKISEMCRVSGKDGQQLTEQEQDSVHPGLVTEGLMTQLLAFGKHNSWASFEKHTRDEVNWKTSKLPWRRSPLWFVIRVALQTVLQRCFPTGEGLLQYKNLMLYLVAEIGLIISRAEHYRGITDHLAIIRAKVGRRISKLQDNTYGFVSEKAMGSSEAIVKRLQQVHTYIRTQDPIKMLQDFLYIRKEDLQLSLKNSRKFLQNAMQVRSGSIQSVAFGRSHGLRGRFNAHGLPQLDGSDIISLADFEQWVDTKLEDWYNRNLPTEECCCALAELFQTYSEHARKAYSGCAEDMSLMLLVMLELWVSLDRMCISICPWFEKFCPEIPQNFLEPLLLPQRHQMHRAGRVEDHIRSRRHACDSDCPSIFDNPGPETFAARYFEGSQEHHELKGRIIREAENKVRQKRDLWQELSDKHRGLVSRASQLPHNTGCSGGGIVNTRFCEKCFLEHEARELNIEVYEWPLPSSDDIMKNVVFEIQYPRWFANWRDLTWKLLDDFGGTQKRSAAKAKLALLDYQGLREYIQNHDQKITLGSPKKSNRRRRKFPVRFDKVSLPSAIQFKLCNSETQEWVEDKLEQWDPTIKPLCTLKVASDAYSHLQYAVDTPDHVENKVIADQRNCHPSISLHEFSAFGHLRSGERLQWYNQIREVASPNLSMRNESVNILFRQAAWELGSASEGTDLREAHQVFTDASCINRLLETVEEKLINIESNWDEHPTLHTLVVMALRAINLSNEPPIVDRAASFLRRCREVAIGWCTNLTVDIQSVAQQILLFKIGGICLLTYSVEPQLLPIVLHNHEDLFFLTRSSILVFSNTPSSISEIPPATKATILQKTKTLHLVEEHMRQLIQTDAQGFNDAIKENVPHLEISSAWGFYREPLERWATNPISSGSQGHLQQIHYNILSGELLIDSCPPGQLPQEYTSHPLFQRLFGARTLTVFPSGLPGTTFTSTKRFGNSQIHFGYEQGQLLVKSQEDGRVLRLIPHDQLLGDFPNSLVAKCAHWLDPGTGEMEFRPLEEPWHSNPRNWYMSYETIAQQHFVMRKGQTTLVDVHSDYFGRIAEVLQTLDKLDHIHVTQTVKGILEVKLVRLHLNFFVNPDGALECREHNAIVDQNQDIGCLYGLSNKLALFDINGRRDRILIVPYGDVHIQKGTYHSQVSIHPPSTPQVKYFYYVFDPQLKVFINTSGILGALYLAYLFALTGYVLPDEATARTGTEEALRILRQARIKPSFPLEPKCKEILIKIGALTPQRQYYPLHLKTTQCIKWMSVLGEMAQHDDFQLVAQRISDYTERFSQFYGVSQDGSEEASNLIDRGDRHLLARARSRRAHIHGSEFGGASASQAQRWVEYDARDRGTNSDRSHHVFEIAALVRDWSGHELGKDLSNMIGRWDHIVLSKSKVNIHRYTYRDILQLSVQDAWGSLYNLCRSSEQKRDSYKLIFLLCAMVFGENEEPQLPYIRQLLAVAFSGGFQGTSLPRRLVRENVMTLPLFHGSEMGSEIRGTISKHYPTFKSRAVPSGADVQNQQEQYSQQKKRELDAFETIILAQWPCERPTRPEEIEEWQEDSFSDLENLFKCRFNSRQFFEFLASVQTRLNTLEIRNPNLNIPLPYPIIPPTPPPRLQTHSRVSATWHPPSLLDMLRESSPPCSVEMVEPPLRFPRLQVPGCCNSTISSELRSLFSTLPQNAKSLRRDYAAHLLNSLEALERIYLPCSPATFPVGRDVLVWCRDFLEEQQENLWTGIISALTTTEDVWKEVGGASVWPSMTVVSILCFLSSDLWPLVPDEWKNTLVNFSKAIASLRRCDRLLRYFDQNDVSGFFIETETVGCEGWDAHENPEWLLLEIESNLTIRAHQAEFAKQMITPQNRANAVLQLNMGEGKTSVITPMVASHLANRIQIARIIVLKPLLRQSVDLLSQSLGGMLNRPVYHIPFSRNTPLGKETPNMLLSIYKECQENRGILIALPEQMLSFRLAGLDKANDRPALALELLRCERMLQENCRTIIDESDEILDANFQLVYARGNQQNIDGENDRWALIQCLLGVVEKEAVALQSEDQACLDIQGCGTRYPIFHFLSADAPHRLLQRVIDAILRGALSGVSFNLWVPQVRESARNFICTPNVAYQDQQTVRNTFDGSIVMRKLLVLRGLLAYNILQFTLTRKRWLVDYGLHPSRCLLAVPYRAKGVPSESAEFGQPDVALTLTCLSYYYEGLSENHVRECFALLGAENDSAAGLGMSP